MHAVPVSHSTGGGPFPGKKRTVISIRVIVTSVALAITCSSMLGVGAVAERSSRRALSREVEARLFLEARSLASASATALLDSFPELVLHPLVKELLSEHPELALAVVVDHGGNTQGHADSRQLGQPFLPPAGLERMPALTPVRDRELLTANRDLLVLSVPAADAGGRILGTVWVGLRRTYVDGVLADARKQVVLILSIALALGMGATFAVMTWLLRPVDVLRSGLERIGQGDLDTPLLVQNRTELGMLAETVNTMAAELKSAQSVLVEKERLAHELDLARDIQRSLLPTGQVRVGAFLVDGTQEPAQEVGGDYYDFFPLDGDKVGVAIADVAGKGLAGCVVMSMLSALLRAYKDDQSSPSALLAELDRKLVGTLQPGTFITMFYGILDPALGTLTYASAAHCPTLVFRRATGTIEMERSTGIPLGVLRDGKIGATLRDHVVEIGPGDMIVQYTDGVNETFDPARREQFGFERLQTLVAACAEAGWPAVLAGLQRELTAFRADGPREDDETLLVIVRDPGAGGALGPLRNNSASGDLTPAEPGPESLVLPARMDELHRLRDWLPGCTGVDGLDGREFEVLASALYEACANIVEHGYANDDSQNIRLTLLPAGPGSEEDPDNSMGHMEFLIQDQGRHFSADNWVGSDFNLPAVRRRGRGFGLDIIHRAMVHVEYRPGTPEGNVTLLVFDPAKHAKERKLRYA